MTRRWAVLADGYLTDRHAKTAHGVIRYSDDDVTCVVDRDHAGAPLRAVLDLGRDAPVVASMQEALAHAPTSLLLGVATPGGWMPDHWRRWVVEAVDAGLEVVNGLHRFLADDADLVARANARGARLWDVRAVPADIPLFTGLSLAASQRIVHTVGTDAAVGKMTVAIELARAARRAGVAAEFVATGQTGIVIAGRGIAVDRVISDFVAGAAERLVLDSNPGAEMLVVEGQGSLWNPAFSGVTLGLLHGCAPHVLVLCHEAGRTHVGQPPHTALPPLPEAIALYEAAAAIVRPARVACVALNCAGMDDAAAHAAAAVVETATGLPAADVLRPGGADRLLRSL